MVINMSKNHIPQRQSSQNRNMFKSVKKFLSSYQKRRIIDFHFPPHRIQSLLAKKQSDVPKGHLAVYVGEFKNRHVIPISYLSHPAFQDLLWQAEEEFEFDHPMGGLTFSCSDEAFVNVTSHLKIS
ncbi:hypothetical protein CASFOL_042071 [Castilleja foliolosa]|uniref:Small auxin up regulated protein n=1 Tax=Castilleja foliolosa TaxID=1961234 RepID=A0ABD3BAS6_9LAMI